MDLGRASLAETHCRLSAPRIAKVNKAGPGPADDSASAFKLQARRNFNEFERCESNYSVLKRPSARV